MVWPPPSPNSALQLALAYSDRFNYPLTQEELWFWQPGTIYPKSEFKFWRHSRFGYFFLPQRVGLVKLRQKRRIISSQKLLHAQKIARGLSYFPGIQAMFITGSLSMNNCPRYDDIDVMIVTTPSVVWIVRPIVVLTLILLGLRRNPGLPEHSSPQVSNKICDNLYLDRQHLTISHSPRDHHRNLYLSHEILQAKCLFDRGGVHHQFLSANSWARKYLPIAYRETLKQCNSVAMKPPSNLTINFFLFILNYSFFIVQYLHMRQRITNEKIGLGYAFFHPRPTPVIS